MSAEIKADCEKYSIVFVCQGNICRSPMALAAFRRFAIQYVWSDNVAADSAGTSRWHVGQEMDPRARKELQRRGYTVAPHLARRVSEADRNATLMIALDVATADRLRSRGFSPDRIHLMSTYDSTTNNSPSIDDPYPGAQANFARVMDRLEQIIPDFCASIEANLRP